jgi:hypothetical protein
MSQPTVRVRYTDDDDVEHETHLPGKWAICGTCRGNGKHSHDLGCITEEDRSRDWSPDEWEDYMNGAYDRQCEECGGSGKVVVIDEDECERQGRGDDMLAYYDELDREAQWAREDRITMYWESGGTCGSLC